MAIGNEYFLQQPALAEQELTPEQERHQLSLQSVQIALQRIYSNTHPRDQVSHTLNYDQEAWLAQLIYLYAQLELSKVLEEISGNDAWSAYLKAKNELFGTEPHGANSFFNKFKVVYGNQELSPEDFLRFCMPGIAAEVTGTLGTYTPYYPDPTDYFTEPDINRILNFLDGKGAIDEDGTLPQVASNPSPLQTEQAVDSFDSPRTYTFQNYPLIKSICEWVESLQDGSQIQISPAEYMNLTTRRGGDRVFLILRQKNISLTVLGGEPADSIVSFTES